MLAEIDSSGNAHYYLPNHRGDTLLILDEDGDVERKIRYDAFGNVTEQTGTFTPRYTFSTKEYLSNAELYLYAYRVYDPIAGRWTQRDPIDYQDSINLYQFCGNNPVNATDADGRAVSKRLYTWGNFTTKALWGGVIEASKAFGSGKSVGKAFLKGARDSAVDFTSKEVGIKDPITSVISETLNQASEGKLFTAEGAKAIGSKATIGGFKAIGVILPKV
jgi:RHS repeat-associated protein